MHVETSSNLYGTTVNPYNRNLSCGGSSGEKGHYSASVAAAWVLDLILVMIVPRFMV